MTSLTLWAALGLLKGRFTVVPRYAWDGDKVGDGLL